MHVHVCDDDHGTRTRSALRRLRRNSSSQNPSVDYRSSIDRGEPNSRKITKTAIKTSARYDDDESRSHFASNAPTRKHHNVIVIDRVRRVRNNRRHTNYVMRRGSLHRRDVIVAAAGVTASEFRHQPPAAAAAVVVVVGLRRRPSVGGRVLAADVRAVRNGVGGDNDGTVHGMGTAALRSLVLSCFVPLSDCSSLRRVPRPPRTAAH